MSLFPIALKARTAANSVMRSLLLTPFVPSSEEPLMSARMNTVNSLSSSKTFTYGAPIRAVTFQSIERTSSPCWYSRFSLNAIPRPLNALAYSPEKILSLKPRDLISTRLTRLSSSTVSISSIPVQDLCLGYNDAVHDLSHNLFLSNVFRFCFKCEADSVSQDIHRNSSYILRCDISTVIHKCMCFCCDA